jgi:hypothetical protein
VLASSKIQHLLLVVQMQGPDSNLSTNKKKKKEKEEK